MSNHDPHQPIVLGDEPEGIRRDLQQHSKTNFMRCLQCRACSSGCPVYFAMDLGPNRIIRLLQLGQFEQAMQNSTIWICVGCDTCSSNCPMAIDIPAVMDVLRQYALDMNASIPTPDIIGLHNEILASIERYGRTHKLEIMLRYKVKNKPWFEDMDIGIKMLSKRKLHLFPSKVKTTEDIREIFRTAKPISWPSEKRHEHI
ncbi:4Fe-4S dicluster domain-containing protein [Desulfovermiculus halophilus]|uniref:4Fe-4S dicluster domain-containing protein n=1 Tax=Desulfovermiculus halophilus TaxID=339722 RepID=UPI0006855010|nr:4Fe-4S dicluster domain-containing protein [Desulfovermiculus halophilus]